MGGNAIDRCVSFHAAELLILASRHPHPPPLADVARDGIPFPPMGCRLLSPAAVCPGRPSGLIVIDSSPPAALRELSTDRVPAVAPGTAAS